MSAKRPTARVRRASLDEIRTMLTYCVRGERFCDGRWGAMIQGGHVQRLLERLAESRAQSRPAGRVDLEPLPGKFNGMSSIQSRVTAQGQISVPAEVRRQLGVGPGSVLVWEWRDGEFVVRRVGKCSSQEIHSALFGDARPAKGKPVDVKAGIRKYMRQRHARG